MVIAVHSTAAMAPFRTDWCEVLAAEDLAAGDIVLVIEGRAFVSHDWSGASGILWRVVIPARSGHRVTLITVKPA